MENCKCGKASTKYYQFENVSFRQYHCDDLGCEEQAKIDVLRTLMEIQEANMTPEELIIHREEMRAMMPPEQFLEMLHDGLSRARGTEYEARYRQMIKDVEEHLEKRIKA